MKCINKSIKKVNAKQSARESTPIVNNILNKDAKLFGEELSQIYEESMTSEFNLDRSSMTGAGNGESSIDQLIKNILDNEKLHQNENSVEVHQLTLGCINLLEIVASNVLNGKLRGEKSIKIFNMVMGIVNKIKTDDV